MPPVEEALVNVWLMWVWPAVRLAAGCKVIRPPSATVRTSVVLSCNLNMLPVEVELLIKSVSAEPEVLFVCVAGPVTAVVPAMLEPRTKLVVEPAVALVPILMVWVAVLPAAAPIFMMLVAELLPRVIVPVPVAVPMS